MQTPTTPLILLFAAAAVLVPPTVLGGGLELHPGGALVPEETRTLQEARLFHEAVWEEAAEAARAATAADRLEEGERQQTDGRHHCRGCLPQWPCCLRPRCKLVPFCDPFVRGQRPG